MRLILFFSGDVETNPGPPKNKGPPGGRPKEPTKEEIMAAMKQKESGPGHQGFQSGNLTFNSRLILTKKR